MRATSASSVHSKSDRVKKNKVEAPTAFADVAVAFTDEEWKMLTKWGKALHREVMLQNYNTMVSLGYSIPLEHLMLLLHIQNDLLALVIMNKEAKDYSSHLEEPSCIFRAKCSEDLKPQAALKASCLDTTKDNPHQGLQCQQFFQNIHLISSQSPFSEGLELNKCFEQDKSLTKVSGPRMNHGIPLLRELFQYTQYEASQVSLVVASLKQINPEETEYKCIDCGENIYYLQLYHQCPAGKTSHGHVSVNEDSSQQNVTKPQQNCSKDKQHKCDQCGTYFSTKSNLRRHNKIHTRYLPYKCTDCDTSFMEKRRLLKHRCSYAREKPYKCIDCEKAFMQRSTLLKHQQIHTEGPYKCTECSKSFTSQSNLSMHHQIHSEEKPYKRTECDKSFTVRNSLTKHQGIPAGDYLYKSPDCDKSYAHSIELERQQQLHSENPSVNGSKPCKRTECDKSNQVLTSLVAHPQIHHGDKEHKCTECNKTFAARSNLRVHQRIHRSEKPHKCMECNIRFNDRKSLVKHHRTHTGERPFKCEKCSKSYIEKYTLLRHQEVHSGEKEYKCTDCEKSFNMQSRLLVHQRFHIRPRPYKCSQCDKRYTALSQLIKHREHHNEQKSPAEKNHS